MSSAQGIDVSSFQSTLTPAELAGYAFAFAKATEGSGGTDARFTGNWAAIKAAGIHRGAYHEMWPGSQASPAAQAAHFLATAKAAGLAPGDMLAVVVSDYTVTDAQANAMLDAVKAGTGGKNPVLVYTDLDVCATLKSCTGYDLWIAWPSGSAPQSVAPFKTWRLWQWGETTLDKDAYNGTAAQMNAWIASYAAPLAPPANWTYGPPQHLAVTGGHTSAKFTWSAPAGAPQPPDSYLVSVYDSAGHLVPSYPRAVPASPYQGGSLKQGESYTVHVAAQGPGVTRVKAGVYASAAFQTG